MGPLVYRLLGRQLLIVSCASAVSIVFGWVVALSVAIGGLVSLVCNFFFARRVLEGSAKGSPHGLILSFYWAELLKIVMAAVLLAAVYALYRELNISGLVVGFLVSQVGTSLSLGLAPVTGEKCN